jgi:hypothetical protein
MVAGRAALIGLESKRSIGYRSSHVRNRSSLFGRLIRPFRQRIQKAALYPVRSLSTDRSSFENPYGSS